MSDCCNDKACAIEALRARQSSTLRIVLAINAVLFVVEFASGLFARSTALLSDSLNNFGDATTYGERAREGDRRIGKARRCGKPIGRRDPQRDCCRDVRRRGAR